MPRCSVIIPAYNVERYVTRAVESALSQTHPDVEVIVVNDGSTDGTSAALEPFRDRIVYVDQSNRGLARARNRALEEASGEYVALLDADDYWLPHRLERILTYLEDHREIGFATSDAYLLYQDRESDQTFYGQLPRNRRFRQSDQTYWITRYNFVFIMTVARRELFDCHGTFDEALHTCEDWDLWIRFITAGEHAGLVGEPLGYYRIRAGSLSRNTSGVYSDMIRILERLRNLRGIPRIPGLAGRVDALKAMEAQSRGDTETARRHFAAASRDDSLPVATRLGARVASHLPGVLGTFQRLRSRRRFP